MESEMLVTFDILEKISQTSSMNAKLELLHRLKENNFSRWYFETVFNPFLTYGVVPTNEAFPIQIIPPTLEILKKIRKDLSERAVTGNAARLLIGKTYNTTDPVVNKWIKMMWTKNLRIGVSTTTINKVFTNLIPVYEIQACNKLTIEQLDSNWVVSKKLNGFRLTIEFDGEQVTAQSRNGKELFNVGHIIAELKPIVHNLVLDGELMSMELQHSWNKTASVARASKSVRNGELLGFNIITCIPLDEWKAWKAGELHVGSVPLRDSLKTLNDLIPKDLKYTKLLENDPVESTEQAWELAKSFLEEGFEGAVAKNLNEPYHWERASNWLKLKFEDSLDLEIVDVYNGTGRNEHRLGGFVVKMADGKTTVKIGGGYSDAQRDEFWAKRAEIVGKVMEVKFQEKTKDGSLLFPVFVKLREDK